MITTACSNCGKVFNLSDDKAGKRGKCHCGSILHVPVREAVDKAQVAPTARRTSVPATVAPTPPSPAPTQQNASGADEHAATGQSQVQQWLRRIKPMSQNRTARLVGAAVVSVLVVGGIGYYKLASDRAEALEQAYRRAEENYERTMAGADRISKNADADFAAAEQLRAQARELREQPASVAAPERKLTRSEAIENEAYIMLVLDRHPQLRSSIISGDIAMNPQIQLLVSQGRLSPSDVSYINRFSKAIQDLPR